MLVGKTYQIPKYHIYLHTTFTLSPKISLPNWGLWLKWDSFLDLFLPTIETRTHYNIAIVYFPFFNAATYKEGRTSRELNPLGFSSTFTSPIDSCSTQSLKCDAQQQERPFYSGTRGSQLTYWLIVLYSAGADNCLFF